MKKTSETIDTLIEAAERPIGLETLPGLQDEYISLINRISSSLPLKVAVELSESVTKDGNEDCETYTPRIVLIGDIHCDFQALKTILLNLTRYDYDYYNKAIFIFLGDYIDRGSSPFQTLRLVLKLKEILGDRCILLRGNHDSFYFSDEENRFMSPVSPSDTIDFFTEYLQPDVIKAFKDFFDLLPWFVLLKRKEKVYFITHGGIPRDDLNSFFSLETFRDIKLPLVTDSKEKVQLRRCLNSLLWGDPVEAEFKYGSGQTRFEFGSAQFSDFMKSNAFTHLIRGHEPKPKGHERMYHGYLITLFSSGGTDNEDSYYADYVPDPAYGIIDEDGNFQAESIFNNNDFINQNNDNSNLDNDLQQSE